MNQKSGSSRRFSRQVFTDKQGEYLAFIYVYAHMFQRPPAETDMQGYFRVSPPSVHQMIVTLERQGLIRRQPGVPRSIEILLPPEQIPILKWLKINQSNPL
jgi:SOS-response transcriptional repressor LexA